MNLATWNQERENLVAENLAAQTLVLESLRKEVGLTLRSINNLVQLRGDDLSAALRHLAPQISRETNWAVRICFFSALRVYPSSEYSDRILGWHHQESDPECLQSLEASLLLLARRSPERVVEHFLKHSKKAQLDAVRFLIKRSRKDENLEAKLREKFDACQFDLEVLSALARHEEQDYNLLSGSANPDRGRLLGRQCSNLYLQQVPPPESSFRRPEFLPYYAKIVESWPAGQGETQSLVSDLTRRHQLTPVAPDVSLEEMTTARLLALRSDSSGALALISLIEAAEVAETRAIRTRATHRPRNSGPAKAPEPEKIVLAQAPPPDPENLLPKRLLPPDHPIRFAKPEA
jgi:hypothetical protein